jgi:hypothetical protein
MDAEGAVSTANQGFATTDKLLAQVAAK